MSWPKECNGAFDDAITHEASANSVTLSWCTSIWLSWPKECHGAVDYAVYITWCWGNWQWHHMTKKGILHFILIILTWGVWWCSSYDVNAGTNGMTLPTESCCTLISISWPKEAVCHWWCCWHHKTLMLVPMTSYDLKCYIAPHLYLSWLKKWIVYWQCHQLHVMPTLAPIALHDEESHLHFISVV